MGPAWRSEPHLFSARRTRLGKLLIQKKDPRMTRINANHQERREKCNSLATVINRSGLPSNNILFLFRSRPFA